MVYLTRGCKAGTTLPTTLALILTSGLVDAQPNRTESEPSIGLEEVVVIAQRREQSLQDVPVAVSAFDELRLDRLGIENIVDIGSYTPNAIVTGTNTIKATVAIRGSVTTNPSLTWEPTVGMYLDGVYISKASGNTFDIAELERIEVLRGPQGTLFGKNTIGGAINLITKKPDGKFGGKVSAAVGNFDYRKLAGTLNLPTLEMGDAGQVLAKFSVGFEERDGFYDNVPSTLALTNPLTQASLTPHPPGSDDYNALDQETYRADVIWEASDNLTLRYAITRSEQSNTPNKPQLTAVNPADLTFGLPMPQDLNLYLVKGRRNADEISTDGPMYEDFDSTSHSLTVTYELANSTLRYIGNVRELNLDQAVDLDGTPISLFHASTEEEYEQMSHEIQWLGVSDHANYVLGVYYFEDEGDVLNPLVPLNDLFGPLLSNNAYGLDSEQIAVYGQYEWRPARFDDRLTATLGLRWTWEEKEGYEIHPGSFSVKDDESWTNFAPTVIAAYDLAPDVNVYGKYARGWKAGGFNGEASSEAAFLGGYDPQEVDSFELGLKSRWLDNRLQVNAAVFHSIESDLQLSVFVGGAVAASVVRNAGESEKSGLELEVVLQATENFSVNANYGYLDATFKSFKEFDPAVGRTVDKRDEKDVPFTPSDTFNIGADYTFIRSSHGNLSAHVDYSYLAEFAPYTNPVQNVTTKVDSRNIVNGRIVLDGLSLGADAGLISISLWGKNLTDETYRIHGVPIGPWTYSAFGAPRTFGLDVDYTF